MGIAAAVLLSSSCGKIYDVNGMDWQPDTPPSDSVFNREIQILNLGAHLPEGHVPADDEDPMFFSLEKFNSVAIGYRSTDRWDIAFSGYYRTEISANNGTKQGFGYGTSAIGGIAWLDAGFDEVTDIPDDSQFTYPGLSGLDDQGAFGKPGGHILYTFFGNQLRPDIMKDDNSADPAVQAKVDSYKHMMYCLSQELVNMFKDVYPLKPRTLIIKTAKGNFAKLETQSIYQDIMNPMDMHRGNDVHYPVYSFRYVIIPASERRFGFQITRPKLTVKL
ncbi:hypothetical protein SAMN05421788_109181 [Filimonas lacunae]|uniref:Uncharacterized protein n=2 Tax=Filimonas lacunae TaxID=477680 RepID=A0A1N7R5G2_9BACT|nr:hypothetical protein SAMN05421788_109181 [Filimonas lacunae]